MRILINEYSGHASPLELSRELTRRGHTVLHLYFADNLSTPKGRTRLGESDPHGLTIEGLHISRQFLKHSLLTRRQADIEYGRVSAARIEQFRPDVVVSGNMPLDAQSIVQTAARRCNARFIFWVQDVYSLAARFVLQRKARILAWAGEAYFKSLEKRLLRDSDAVICISEDFVETIRKWGIRGPQIHVLENWAPLDEVFPIARQNQWALEQGLTDQFCFLYSGTLGMKHRPELLLELAEYLQVNKCGKLVVVAAGAGADWLAAHSSGLSPEVLKLLPFQPYERVGEVLGSGDVLITLLDSEAGSFAVPSKTLSYLCAGRALIIAAPSNNEAARVVQRATAGFVVSPDDPGALVEAAKLMLHDKTLCAEYGRNARLYAERTFSIQVIANKFLSVITPDTFRDSVANSEHNVKAEAPVAPSGGR